MESVEGVAKPLKRNRTWFQFGLRTLLALVTAIAVGLGGRMAYLRRYATFHEREAEKYLEKMEREHGDVLARHGVLDGLKTLGTAQERIEFIGNLRWNATGEDPEEAACLNNDAILLFRHHFLSVAFRKAIYTPWRFVDMHLPSDAQPAKQ